MWSISIQGWNGAADRFHCRFLGGYESERRCFLIVIAVHLFVFQDSVKEGTDKATSKAQEAGKDLQGKAEDATSSAQSSFKDASRQAEGSVRDVSKSAQSGLDDASSKAKSGIDDASRKTEKAANDLKN